ncbi:DNA cytosine methyltransferase [Rhodococcus sp. BP-349]|nr:DNA cytosine methyltransferase [Rhodococcus sp. BP-363]MBY6543618.1 DNA cytosine methyltransferase [Rhodococcus sp. BP-369]MBY6562848.1 DNA cytosine methyltransferase [Rhodococcus sp. BP-370]MBY6577140.1 DNA cytosine methyltransferase [Rhodococcus sp. BP-364]MBY6586441.1 DNA cytosine methyltransferase [Rhodococcus sp. BP-358]MBY6590778.1 DNA cytosine methyltransferase [Rhodococcus sp. BP-362]MBY6595888.1 DNA cytosine methyltransferase [Rhodococcus sp. BP-359]MBY6600227.1 DNA cytosine meth
MPDLASRHEVVDLFAGPGGLDVGAHWLGMKTNGIELDRHACATRASARLPTVRGDVRDFGPDDFADANILAGGPPCQTYTLAGNGAGRQALNKVLALVDEMAGGADVTKSLTMFEDERTGLVLEPLRWALQAVRLGRPYEAVVMEQVPAVLPIWQAIQTALERHGYGADCGILRTEQFGVPQTRRRAILIARWQGQVRLPAPTHQHFRKGVPRQAEMGLEPWVSMSEALGREHSFTVVSNYGSGGDPKNRGRREWDEPSATVTGKVTRNRIELADGTTTNLTLQEAGRLQTFPSDYPWSGNDVSQQIGNAIPPRLAAHVLAAATGMTLDPTFLDRAVTSKWSKSSGGVPMLSGVM